MVARFKIPVNEFPEAFDRKLFFNSVPRIQALLLVTIKSQQRSTKLNIYFERRIPMKHFPKTLRSFCCLMLTAILLFGCIPAASAAAYVPPEGMYINYTFHKNTCTNVKYAYGAGADINTDWPDGQSNEIWILKHTSGGYFTLSPLHASNCYLSAEKGFDQTLTLTRTSSDYTQWKALPNRDGSVVLQCKGNGLVMDNAYGHIDQVGTRTLAYEKNGFAEAQHHWLSRISESTSQLTPPTRVSAFNKTCVMKLNNSEKVLNIAYAKKTDGALLVVDNLNGGAEANEIFEFRAHGNLVSIHPSHAKHLALGCADGDPMPGRQITAVTYRDGDPNTLWEVYKYSDGTYGFRNAKTKLFLDNLYCRTNDGNPLISCQYTASSGQRFTLPSVPGSTASSGISPRQKAMADQAVKYLGSTRYSGYCQRYVRIVGEDIGLPGGNAASALEACSKWRVSTSLNDIPVGAAVYLRSKNTSSAGYRYGHVGIYLGDGMVAHAQSTVKKQSLSSLLSSYNYLGWGWQAGVPLK